MSTDHYPRFRNPRDGRLWFILGWVSPTSITIRSYEGVQQTVRKGSLTFERAKAVLEGMGIPAPLPRGRGNR